MLMDNYEQLKKIQEGVVNSVGSAEQKFDEFYKNSFEAKMNSMKQSLETLYATIIDKKAVKSGIDTVTKLLTSLNSFLQLSSQVKLSAVALGATIFLLAKNFTFLMTELRASTTITAFFKSILDTLFATTATGVGATGLLNGALSSLKITLMSLLTTPVGWFFTAFTIAIGVATNSIIKHIKHQKELKDQTEQLKGAYDNLNKALAKNDINGIKMNAGQFDEAQKKIQNLIQERNKLQASLEQTAKTDPSNYMKYDKILQQINDLNAKIKDEIKVIQDAGMTVDEHTGKIKQWQTAQELINLHDTMQQIYEEGEAKKKNAQATIDLINRYIELNSIQNKSAAQQREMSNVTNQLKGKIDGLTISVDKNGNAIITNTKFLGEQKRALEMDIQMTDANTQAKWANAVNSMQFEYNKTKYTVEQVKARIDMYKKEVDAMSAANSNFDGTYVPANIQAMWGWYESVGSKIEAIKNSFSISAPPSLSSSSPSWTPPSDGSSGKKGKGHKDKKDKSKTEHTYDFDGADVDIYESRLKTIQNEIAKTESAISNLDQIIANLHSSTSNRQAKQLKLLDDEIKKIQEQKEALIESNKERQKILDLSKIPEDKDKNVTGKEISFGKGQYTTKDGQLIDVEGIFKGKWAKEWEVSGNIARQEFQQIFVENGKKFVEAMFLSPDEDKFVAWQDSETFEEEVAEYKKAYLESLKKGNKSHYWQNYINDSGYSYETYDVMAELGFDAKKLKDYFIQNPNKIQWKQDSIPFEQLEKAKKELDETNNKIKQLDKNIQNLNKQKQNNPYEVILQKYNNLIDAQIKKGDSLTSKYNEVLNIRNSLTKAIYKNWAVLKSKDLSKFTQENWDTYLNQFYGKDIKFKTEAQKKRYDDGKKLYQQYVKDYESLTKELEKIDADKLKQMETVNNAIKTKVEWQEKIREAIASQLKDKTGDIQDKIDLLEIDEKAKYNWQERIKLHKELLAAQKSEQNFIKDGIEKYKIQLGHLKENTTEWSLVTNIIEEYNEKLDESNKIIATQIEKLKEVEKMQLENLASTEDKIVAALKKKYEEEIKLAKEKKAKELLLQKKLTEEQLKLIKEGSKTALEIFEEEHEAKIKALNDELKAYEEIYQAKIKEIDRKEDKDTYEKDLNKKQQEKAKLQAQYDSLLMDSSLEAQSKREDLLKDIEKKSEEINEFIHKRDITLRKQNLQDELEAKKKAIQKKIDEENEAYKKAKKLYDQEVKALEKANEEKLKAEKLYAEARRLLMEGNLAELTTLMEKYGEDSEKIFGSMGNSIKKNIIDNLKIAIDSMKELANAKIFKDWEGRQTDDNGNQVMRDNPTVSKNKQWKIKMNKEIDEASLKDKIFVVDEKGQKVDVDVSLDSSKKNILISPRGDGYEKGKYQLAIEKGVKSTDGKELMTPSTRQNFKVEETGGKNEYFRSQYDFDKYQNDPEYKKLIEEFYASIKNPSLTKPDSYWQEKSNKILQKYKKYETGGLNDSTGWHWLDGTPSKPELVLNAKETDAMLGLKKYLPPLLDSIKMPTINIPKLNIPNLSNMTSSNPIELKIEKLINIEGNADKTTLPEIKKAGMDSLGQLKQALNKQGIRRVLP